MSLLQKKGNVLCVNLKLYWYPDWLYGHPAGDAVLQKCVSVISSKLREHDIVIRYAGDEFIIVLERISKKEVRYILTRLEQAVKENPVEFENKTISMK